MKLKVVIDTNVYISAIFWNGNPRKIIELGRDGKIEIYTSKDIIGEISDVLMRKFKLESYDVERILIDFSSFTILVNPIQSLKIIKQDPDDDKFIECAVSCDADYIISGDRHLINLKEYKDIRILNPLEFLLIINEHK